MLPVEDMVHRGTVSRFQADDWTWANLAIHHKDPLKYTPVALEQRLAQDLRALYE